MTMPNGDDEEEMISFNRRVRLQSMEALRILNCQFFLSGEEQKRREYLIETIQKCERYLIDRAQKEWKRQ